MAGTDRWNPWRALRERPHIELRFAELGPGLRGLWQRDELGDVIVLDVALDRRARRCVLAHELVHAERGIGHGAASAASMELEEARTRRVVADRLVPPAQLAPFAAMLADVVGGVTARDVAEEFDVEPDVAELALALLVSRAGAPAVSPRCGR